MFEGEGIYCSAGIWLIKKAARPNRAAPYYCILKAQLCCPEGLYKTKQECLKSSALNRQAILLGLSVFLINLIALLLYSCPLIWFATLGLLRFIF